MLFNINDNVRIKLTNRGKEILCGQHVKIIRRFPQITYEFTLPKEDENGWSEWQLWKLMEAFGDYIGMGTVEYPFELTIDVRPYTAQKEVNDE